MIFFSIGLPSRFTEWCDLVTERLARHALGSVEVAALNSLDELALGMIRTDAPHFLACCRQPVGRLQAAVAQANKRFIVTLGDPRSALRDLMNRPGVDLVSATRAIASSCAALLTLSSVPGALVFSGKDAEDPLAVAESIARHLDLDVGRADIVGIIDGLAELGAVPAENEAGAWWGQIDEAGQVLADGAVQPYLAYFAGGDLETIVWEPALFFMNEDPPAQPPVPAERPIDITGRVRFLVYGPFINLPPGSWSAKVVLGFSPEAAGMSYIIEVFAGTQLAHLRIQPVAEDVVEANLHFSIDEGVDQPIQIRIMNERAAFDGRLALGYVAMTPQATIRIETRAYLARMLGARTN